MQLSAIRTEAMYWADEPTAESSGKFSEAWWNVQINYIQHVLAQETGYYRFWHPVSVTANVRTIAAPTTLCWGILKVLYRNAEVEGSDIHERAEDYPSWRDGQAGSPVDYTVEWPNIELRPPPDRTCVSAGTLLSATAGGNFSNQPADDSVEVVSSSSSDTTQTVDIYGTTFQTGTVVKETVTLTGDTAVETDKDDWGDILGIELSAACAGTITIREASGDQAITTITAGNTTAGVATPTSTDGGKVQPLVAASSTSTAVVGLVGTDASGTAMTDNCVGLCGTADTTQTLPYRMDTVTKVLLGAVASAQNVTVTRGAALYMLGGKMASDMADDTDTPTGLPVGFHDLLATGAAAMGELSDIYEAQQAARSTALGTAFWNGVARLNEFLDTMQRDRQQSIRVDTSLYWQHFNRS